MEDDTNNPNSLEPWIDPALEARIVALVLGEASDFERAELETLIESQPELQAFHDRIQSTDLSLQLSESPTAEAELPDWKLPSEKRDALLEKFRTPAVATTQKPVPSTPKTKRSPRRIAPWISVAAAVVLLLLVALPVMLSRRPNQFAPAAELAAREEREGWTMYSPLDAEGEGSKPSQPPLAKDRYDANRSSVVASSENEETTFKREFLGGARNLRGYDYRETELLAEYTEETRDAAIVPRSGRNTAESKELEAAGSRIAVAESTRPASPSEPLIVDWSGTLDGGTEITSFFSRSKAQNTPDYAPSVDPGITGDWDSGIGNSVDGPYVNRPTDGKDEQLGYFETVTGGIDGKKLAQLDDSSRENKRRFSHRFADKFTASDSDKTLDTDVAPQDAAIAFSKFNALSDPPVAGGSFGGGGGGDSLAIIEAQAGEQNGKHDSLSISQPLVTTGKVDMNYEFISEEEQKSLYATVDELRFEGIAKLSNTPSPTAQEEITPRPAEDTLARATSSNLDSDGFIAEKELQDRIQTLADKITEPEGYTGLLADTNGTVDSSTLWMAQPGAITALSEGTDSSASENGITQPNQLAWNYTTTRHWGLTSPPAVTEPNTPFTPPRSDVPVGGSALADGIRTGESAIRGESIVNQEMFRRLSSVTQSESEILEADQLATEGKIEAAVSRYHAALDKLPNAPMTEEARKRAISGLADTTVKHAHQLAQQGRFEEAQSQLSFALSPEIDPENEEAKQMLNRLDDKDFYNQAISKEHREGVDEVERRLRLATGYYDIGDYDNAEKNYNAILRIDKYNESARQGLENNESAREHYFKTNRDHMRGKMLAAVDEIWEWSVPAEGSEAEKTKAKESDRASADSELNRAYRFGRDTDFVYEDGATTVLTDPTSDEFFRYPGHVSGTSLSSVLKRSANSDLLDITDRTFFSPNRVISGTEQLGQIDPPTSAALSDDGFSPSIAAQWDDADSYKGKRVWGAHGGVRLFSADLQEGQTDALFDDVPATASKQSKMRSIIVPEIESLATVTAPTPDTNPKQKATADLSLETLTSDEPFSTFSLNVSDVSFKLAKTALLENNTFPATEKVRVEEFVNAFDYGDTAPSLSEKVACNIDQAAHPFLQQRNLMRVSMQTAAAGRSADQPLRLTILLDKSGSMERSDREESVLRTMQALAKHLGPNDKISAIAFSRQPHLIADQLGGERAEELVNLVANTPSSGGTNLEEALKLADTLATRQFEENATNRIVLITDGAANLGDADPESLKEKVIALRQRGIAFDACGVGADGLNDTTLEALTRKGDGRYYFLDRPEDADSAFIKQLAGSLRPAAKNVKVQVKFNSERVTRYRLAGFEKHRLEKQDFRNDAVDAAEMAAAESGNAIYQFEANPQGKGDVGEVFVRFLDTNTGKMVERSWPIPYQDKAPRLGEATHAMQLSATAAFLGEKLKGGATADTIDLAQLAPITNQLRNQTQSPRVQALIQMVEKARSLSK